MAQPRQLLTIDRAAQLAIQDYPAVRASLAQAQLAGARRVAQNTPIELEAARAARSRRGATSLMQAEIDDALARLGVWRGLLAVAAAQGDLHPFLETAGK